MSYLGGFIRRSEARRPLLPVCREIIILLRGTEGNHKSKHISSRNPFLFLPMCLSQRLAQVSRIGSSSLARTGLERVSLQGSMSFLSLRKLTPLLHSLLSTVSNTNLLCFSKAQWWGLWWVWPLRGRLSPSYAKCYVSYSVLSRLGQGSHTTDDSCSGPHVRRYGKLLQISFTYRHSLTKSWIWKSP